jgi:hypothetical protein
MKHQIKLQDWESNNICGDGCCGDFGTKLTINGELITHYYQGTDTDIKMILEAFDIEYEFIDEENPSDNQ